MTGAELGQAFSLQLERIKATSRVVDSDAGLGLERWSTPAGEVWAPRDDSAALFEILAEQGIGIYDAEQVRIKPGDVVLDVGAHIGLFTRRAPDMGAAKVIAIILLRLQEHASCRCLSRCVFPSPWQVSYNALRPDRGERS